MAASGIEAGIADALYWRLSQLTLTPAQPIAWPNVEFTASGDYLAASLLPAETDVASLGVDGFNRHAGLFQVSAFTTEGAGEIGLRSTASEVAAHFKRGTVITRNDLSVRIFTPPTVGPALPEPGWLSIPVTVRWRCDAQNPA